MLPRHRRTKFDGDRTISWDPVNCPLFYYLFKPITSDLIWSHSEKSLCSFTLMEGNLESTHQISTLKVDFGCSTICPLDVKNMLEQLKEVKSISIDPNEGKVTVEGNVNPMMLIKFLKKMGKKAQLWSFNKGPMQRRAGSQPKQKHAAHCCCESNDPEDDSIHYKAHYGQSSKKRHDPKDGFGFGNKRALAPPPPGIGYNYPWHQPFSGYHCHPSTPWFLPVTYARPMPRYGYYGRGHSMLPIYGHFDSRVPKDNPMIHYTSYGDNYRYNV
ncbi:hypothetical protein VNO77_24144 [Canavalia gladiata]|uniref:HMA domain-containing protein n=1 Tax=Canavalia gladiata TaxID=3824 RepID=A0AAN9QC76_CANGL